MTQMNYNSRAWDACCTDPEEYDRDAQQEEYEYMQMMRTRGGSVYWLYTDEDEDE